MHTAPAPASSEPRQNPLQHSKPAVHEAGVPVPVGLHGASAQYPNMLADVASCPGNQNAGWLGSTVPSDASTAVTQSCFWFAHVASCGGALRGDTMRLP